jgi:iron complex outermembrane receptor protein
MKKGFVAIVSLFLLTLFLAAPVHAQYGPGSGGGNGGFGGGTGGGKGSGQGTGQARPSIGHVFGKIIDAKTKKPVEFASVALFKARNDSLITGMLTETNGEFSLDNLPFGKFKLKVSFLGYTTLEKDILIMSATTIEQDLGNVALSQDDKTLNAVTITGEKATIELKPDRKVFNVEKDLSTRGGTGEDVMKNIPGVSVDGSGNVTLRNLSPIIYVDGKPTTLTLDQIPADQIDRVEVITNPSAKYEADATGGIINVVLKQNRLPGYNGQITAAIGTNDQYNGSALLNVKEKKFGFMLNYNVHGSTNNTLGGTNRTDFAENGDVSDYLHQNDNFILKRVFQTARVGFDGYIDNHNTLSLIQSGTFGNFNNIDNQGFTTDSANGHQITNGNLDQSSTTAFRNFTTNLTLRHTYTKPDKEWSLDLSYNHSHVNTNSLNTYSTYNAKGIPVPYDTIGFYQDALNPQNQTQTGTGKTDMITAQWDFSDPIKSNMKIEFGFRSSYQHAYSLLNVYNTDSSFTELSPALSSNYATDNLINAAYFTFSHNVKGFSYELGMRFEQTYFNGTEYNYDNTGRDSSFSYKYPNTHPSATNILDCFFPSIMLSEKINEKNELQFNITRKINRPGFRQIAPFISGSTPYGYSVGNVALQPEFDNKAEFNYDLNITQFTWLSSIYGSYNQQPITPYTFTSSVDSLQIVSTYENAKSSFNYGWENTFKITPVKGLDITADVNVFYTYIQSDIDTALIHNEGYSYVVKGIISYKFPLAFVAQVNGTYEAPKVIAQGNTLPVYFIDASVSKDFGIAALTLAVSDIMNTKSYGTYYSTPTYTETTIKRRDERYARLGVTFKFGKMDGSLFRKKQQKKDNNAPNPDDMGF